MSAISEMILPTKILPAQLLQFIQTEKVKVDAYENEVRLTPFGEPQATKDVTCCPFLGMYTDGKLTVDGYLARKRIESIGSVLR